MIFGCFLGLFILRYYIDRFVKIHMQRQSTIDYVAVLFIMILFTVVVLVLYIRWAGLDTFRLKGIDYKIWLWTFMLWEPLKTHYFSPSNFVI